MLNVTVCVYTYYSIIAMMRVMAITTHAAMIIAAIAPLVRTDGERGVDDGDSIEIMGVENPLWA